ncbi:MAG TPA: sensor histidine kinase [Gaiellaceae bacterium]|nr:sensor histidine kinase [Gaiellaceae bacterium]
MTRVRHIAREYWFELLIVALTIAAMLQLIVNRDSPGAPTVTLWFSLPAMAALVLPLLAYRRYPFAAPASYWLLAIVITLVDGTLIPYVDSLSVVGLAAAFLLGNVRDSSRAWLGLAIVVVAMLVVVHYIPGEQSANLYVFITLRYVAAWIAGYALRERSEQAYAAEVRAARAEHERESAARVAVAEERSRIARELHDIVAHAVSVMVLQVGAVRHKLPDSMAEDRDALRGVERAGRTALAEMRRLLAAMRPDGDEAELVPQPGLDGLNSLLAEVGRAGLPVELHLEGQPYPLPRGLDLSAYRIVQEGLTNVLKHAGASDADVIVRYRPDEVEIEVRDNGGGASAGDGLGHGLVGIRERVKIYGGEMSARAEPEGGFVLSTRLPVVEESA